MSRSCSTDHVTSTRRLAFGFGAGPKQDGGNEGAEQATEEAGGVQLGGIPIGSRASGTEEHVPARISHHAEGAVRW